MKNNTSNKKTEINPEESFSEGTGGTGGTVTAGAASSCSPKNNAEGTGGTKQIDNPERIEFANLKMPCFLVKDDWFYLEGKLKPGVYHCYETKAKKDGETTQHALFICSPLYVDGVTNTEDEQYFGRLLRFRDTRKRWRTWAMPMETLRGSCDELRGELLAAGVEIDNHNRNRLADYLQWQIPKRVITAATRTGWTKTGQAFVLHNRVIGDEDVHFQSESIGTDGTAKTGGDYHKWQAMIEQCEHNPVLISSVCVALAGPLLVKANRGGDSGGIHWIGDSSIGKTTALNVGASVWGGEDFKRTWRATSNGLEGVAALLSDTCLCLDEISEADPREVGAIVYSLGNGVGKTRANRIGSAREAKRWRLTILSTGERSMAAAMQEGGKQAKAGQSVRLLNIPAARQFGVFDELHGFDDGRVMADYFKSETVKHYGHAGVKFVEHILSLGDIDHGAELVKIEKQFEHSDSQAARAASRFAIYALAGEMAIQAGILPWPKDSALNACLTMFESWHRMRGTGVSEDNQILQNVLDYILKYGDTKFTKKGDADEKPRLDRAGWYTEILGERVYLLTPAAIKEAGGGYDTNRIIDALDSAGWIADRDKDKRSKSDRIGGTKTRLYWIMPLENVPPVPPSNFRGNTPQATNTKAVPPVPPVPPEKTNVDEELPEYF